MTGGEPCLHCGGDGLEPFSDGETCGVCLGEKTVPRKVNRRYYEQISDALDEGSGKETMTTVRCQDCGNIETIPFVIHDGAWECPECGYHNYNWVEVEDDGE